VPETALDDEARAAAARRIAERKARKRSERRTYLVVAVMSSLGVTSMAVAAVYYRFSWQMEVTRRGLRQGPPLPVSLPAC
jgi:beta-carotene 3-hydroxylase